jgi:hypothetical protein
MPVMETRAGYPVSNRPTVITKTPAALWCQESDKMGKWAGR